MDNTKESINKRAINFSKSEEEKLVALVLKNRNIIENKKTDAVTSKKKQEIWEQLSSEFNAGNSQFRTVKAIKDKYKNIKRNIRKSKAVERRERLATGGGPPPKENITPGGVIDELCDVIGISIEGLNSRLDDDQTDKLDDGDEMNADYLEDIRVYDDGLVGELNTDEVESVHLAPPVYPAASAENMEVEQRDNSTASADWSQYQPAMLSQPRRKILQTGKISKKKFKKPAADKSGMENLDLKKQILEEQLLKVKLENEEIRQRMQQSTTEHLLRVELVQLQIKELQKKHI